MHPYSRLSYMSKKQSAKKPYVGFFISPEDYKFCKAEAQKEDRSVASWFRSQVKKILADGAYAPEEQKISPPRQ